VARFVNKNRAVITTIPIYVIGSSNTDMVIRTQKLPMPGETVMGTDFIINPGGKGANQAVAAARLGNQITFIAKVGNDLFGRQALEHFQRERIDTSFVSIDSEHPSGVALIGVDAQGENSIMVAPGSNAHLDVESVGQALNTVQSGSIILLQLEIPMETVAFAIKKANSTGCKVILNPAPANIIDPELLRYVHVITPNESEAEILTGVRVTDIDTAARASQKLHDLGVANIVITLGSKGAFLSVDSTQKLIPTPVVTPVDTTAAGDCFNGALAIALSEGLVLEKAVRFACVAASISVTRMGAQSSMPYRKEADDIFLHTHKKSRP
jgi:ribokinase